MKSTYLGPLVAPRTPLLFVDVRGLTDDHFANLTPSHKQWALSLVFSRIYLKAASFIVSLVV